LAPFDERVGKTETGEPFRLAVLPGRTAVTGSSPSRLRAVARLVPNTTVDPPSVPGRTTDNKR
jgi:hypothetical protein